MPSSPSLGPKTLTAHMSGVMPDLVCAHHPPSPTWGCADNRGPLHAWARVSVQNAPQGEL